MRSAPEDIDDRGQSFVEGEALQILGQYQYKGCILCEEDMLHNCQSKGDIHEEAKSADTSKLDLVTV